MKINWKNVEDHPLGRMDEKIESEKSVETKFTLFAGYEDLRMLAVEMAEGGFQHFIGNIDQNGSICDDCGDDTGWTWEDVSHWADFNSPNS